MTDSPAASTSPNHDSLEQYCGEWELSRPELLAQTYTSHVYTVQVAGETFVLKILSDAGIEDESKGSHALQYFDGHGAIRLLRHDAGAMLLEYVDGGDLVPMVGAGKDDEATAVIASVLNELHLTYHKDLPGQLTPLKVRFRSLFARAEKERSQDAGSLYVRGAVVADRLLADEAIPCVLHGDIHHENIRHHKDRGWLAIDPKGLVGDRVYDAANALCQPGSMPEIVENRERLLHRADIMASIMGVDHDRLLAYAFAHCCLSACWSIEDRQDPSHAIAMAQITETCL